MEVKAVAKYVRVSPRKARLVVDLIRGKRIDQALAQLMFVNKKPKDAIVKVIRSAVANAEHNFKLPVDGLYIKTVLVDGAFMLKRSMPRAFGRAYPIRKRSSHITVIVALKDFSKEVVEDDTKKKSIKKKQK